MRSETCPSWLATGEGVKCVGWRPSEDWRISQQFIFIRGVLTLGGSINLSGGDLCHIASFIKTTFFKAGDDL